MRILIIDDDPPVRDMIATVMRREGFEPVVTCHGRAAVDVIDRAEVDEYAAIVLQVNATPSRLDAAELTGFALLNHMRRHKPQLIARTVVATTMSRLRESPGCAVLIQPFDIEELVEAVRQCAGR